MTPTPTAETISSTPLVALSAIALDTETTGLDTSAARVIQIGGVRIDRGRLVEAGSLNRLVKPDVKIPPRTTEIHGLTDADVAGAPLFADIADTLEKWTGRSIWLGYAIGFDLAVLSREYERARRPWVQPRALDVRHLVQIVSPNIPDQGLETVAEWLGLDVEGRHTALGDAILTAKVYLALLPRLLERNIRTLAEAEAACRSLIERADGEHAAGWRAAVGPSEALRRSFGALARIDSFPYRHKVRDLMSAPAIAVPPDASLREVLRQLIDRQISSVLVEPEAGQHGHGIVTERDLLRAINAAPDEALARSAGDIAIRPVKCTPQDDFVYRAVSAMTRGGFRHLGVCDENGKLVGMVTTRDLLKQRAGDAISLGDAIGEAATAEDLAAIWAKLAVVAAGLVYEGVDPRDCAAIISSELCALTAHACEIAEREMAEAGAGAPPVPYAMFVLGSGGRGESLLAMDQDNAIVYSAGDGAGEVDAWFARLGARVADILNLAGVPYCKGGVMAKNAEWRMSVADWKQRISGWIRRQHPDDILNTDIFFDAVPVHGARELAEEVIDHAFEVGRDAVTFLKLMSMNAARIDVPLGLFGRFQTVNGRIDLKKHGILPIFSTARVLAIRHAVRNQSTPVRLQAVRGKPDLSETVIDNAVEAHRILLGAILDQQLEDLQIGIPLSNKVDPKPLTTVEKEQLKWALRQTGSLGGLLGDPVSFL